MIAINRDCQACHHAETSHNNHVGFCSEAGCGCTQYVFNYPAALEQELTEYRLSFDLYHKALKTLTARYHKAHPDQIEVLPDLGHMAAWCSDEVHLIEADRDACLHELRRISQKLKQPLWNVDDELVWDLLDQWILQMHVQGVKDPEPVEVDLVVATCRDCGMPYEDFPMDLVLPDAQWQQICPEGGILCAACTVARIAVLVPDAMVIRAEWKTLT